MLLTLTFLIVGRLHYTQPTHVADLHPKSGYSVQLHERPMQGIKLQPAQPTVVKTWNK